MDKDINILVVDDFSTMRRIVRNLLTDLGFKRVAEAGAAASTQATLVDGNFDPLIAADGNLPKTAGKDLFAAVLLSAQLQRLFWRCA